MIRCDIEEDSEALLARFFGRLNKEIQTILEYKEYNAINHLFHLPSKAECEVQDRRAAAPRTLYTPRTPAPSPSLTTPSRPSSAPAPPSTRGAPAVLPQVRHHPWRLQGRQVK
jgi:hypothetical protein